MMVYPCKLSKEALAKAVDELNEPVDDRERKHQIDTLRNAFLTNYPNLKLSKEDDAFVVRFLRAKKYDQAKALDMMFNYHVQLQEWPELQEKISNPLLVKHAFEKGVVCPLEGKAKNGSCVVLMRPGFDGCSDLVQITAAMFLTVDKLLEDEDNQVYGVVVIIDLAFLNFGIVKQMSPFLAIKLTKTLEESPLIAQSINFTNEPKVFSIIYAVIYPLLSEKHKHRLHLHGNNFTSLYGFVDRSNLPFMFNGNGPEPDAKNWLTKVFNNKTTL